MPSGVVYVEHSLLLIGPAYIYIKLKMGTDALWVIDDDDALQSYKIWSCNVGVGCVSPN